MCKLIEKYVCIFQFYVTEILKGSSYKAKVTFSHVARRPKIISRNPTGDNSCSKKLRAFVFFLVAFLRWTVE